MPETSFPKRPDGTTDWERVFEDSADGFVPRIERAESPAALRETAMEIAGLLFSRADDDERLRKLYAWINGVVPENSTDTASLPKKKSDIVRLLRHVEEERTLKAARFVEQKKAIAEREEAGDRRDSSSDTFLDTAMPGGKGKKGLIFVALGIVVLIGLAAIFLM